MTHLGMDRWHMLAEAAEHLRSALELLDSAAAPGQIGAHVDLAAHQLQGELAQLSADNSNASPAEASLTA